MKVQKSFCMKNKWEWWAIVLLLSYQILAGQSVKSVLCGTVSDESSSPLRGVLVEITTSAGKTECFSDSLGNFCSDSIEVGRVNVRIELEQYTALYFNEIEIKTGNSAPLQITLQEKVTTAKEVVLKGKSESKDKPNNSMALIGARRLSMEEASRYAGGFDDPARLASSFGGVAGGIGNNGIAVRGNKPGSFQWRMEGMEIPNPNHFADVVSFGAGGLSALSAQLISSADFYTGGFPAEYGNALSGIMDIKIRNGNALNRKYGFKIGAIGTEFSTEGPFKKGNKSTYNVHYRYSTLSLISFLLPPEAGGIKYQDMSMKLYFPTKAGKFSLWYLGALDKSGQQAEYDSLLWKYDYLREAAVSRQGFSVAGLSHRVSISKGFNWNSTGMWTTNIIKHDVQRLNDQLQLNDYQKIHTTTGRFSFHTGIDKKFGSKHLNKTGIFYSILYYGNQLLIHQNALWDTIANKSGQSGFLQLYSQSRISIGERLLFVAGIHSSYIGLTHQQTLEPRFSASYQLNEKQRLAISYGNHSQLERIQIYAIQNSEGELVNKNLKLSRAHHESIAYELQLTEKLRWKMEVYAQQLYNIPVVDSSSFSMINMTGDWFFQNSLVNKGEGRNIGFDLTLERFMGNGFYYLITGSLFDSRYKGGDGIWRETRYNRNWIANVLLGKEWNVGTKKNKLASINIRFTYQGGEKITPVLNTNETLNEIDNQAFSQRLPNQPLLHVTANFRINKSRHASIWSLQLLNALSTPEIYGYVYNRTTDQIDYRKDVLLIPNISYKVEF
jgi:hypothetical protein